MRGPRDPGKWEGNPGDLRGPLQCAISPRNEQRTRALFQTMRQRIVPLVEAALGHPFLVCDKQGAKHMDLTELRDWSILACDIAEVILLFFIVGRIYRYGRGPAATRRLSRGFDYD